MVSAGGDDGTGIVALEMVQSPSVAAPRRRAIMSLSAARRVVLAMSRVCRASTAGVSKSDGDGLARGAQVQPAGNNGDSPFEHLLELLVSSVTLF